MKGRLTAATAALVVVGSLLQPDVPDKEVIRLFSIVAKDGPTRRGTL